MGDFNFETTEELLNDFCEAYSLKILVMDPTCFKSTENPSCIDLMLTNRHRSFQCTTAIEIDLSDCHKMTVTVMKTFFKKGLQKLYMQVAEIFSNLFSNIIDELCITKYYGKKQTWIKLNCNHPIIRKIKSL